LVGWLWCSCIRLSNNAFRTKVAEVDGGLEVMMSAGFVLSEEEEEGQEGGGGDTFLRHYGNNVTNDNNDLQLEYVLSRTQQVYSVIFQ
jgi:hypothetical protein